MDKAVKEKWVEALLSGKYRQHQGALRDGNGNAFCCLGVLCDITPDVGWDEGGRAYYGNDVSPFVLPSALRRDLVMPTKFEEHVATMNDDGKSFAEIADYIRKTL